MQFRGNKPRPKPEKPREAQERHQERVDREQKPPGNVVFIRQPEANYRIIYENHTKAHDPSVVGTVDALGIEFRDKSFDTKAEAEDTLQAFWRQYSRRKSQGNSRHGSIEGELIRDRVPAYLVDIPDPDGLFESIKNKAQTDANMLRVAGNFIVGAALVEGGVRSTTGTLSRRGFLRLMGQSAAGSYFALPSISVIVASLVPRTAEGHLEENAVSRDLDRDILSMQEKYYLENTYWALILTFRNAVFAQKLQQIASLHSRMHDHKPEIGMITGAAHVGIEKMLAIPEKERVAYIKLMIEKFGLASLARELHMTPELRFDSRSSRWLCTNILEDLSLKNALRNKGGHTARK